jgi:hypothetical protein
VLDAEAGLSGNPTRVLELVADKAQFIPENRAAEEGNLAPKPATVLRFLRFFGIEITGKNRGPMRGYAARRASARV